MHEAFPGEIERVIEEATGRLLLRAAPPAEWKVSVVQFREALARSAANGPAASSEKGVRAYLESLHIEDLAFACALSDGNEPAWEYFIRAYRQQLYRAGRAVAGESLGRELADSLYAELYGLGEREGKRRSLFEYFYGRSKLSTWLRAILAQRFVDEIRRMRRTDSLDEQNEGEPVREIPSRADEGHPGDPEKPRYLALLQAALEETIGNLEPRARLRLAYYYEQELTLAQIGRLLGEHEATVSRNLERARQEIRASVERALVEKKRLSEAQVRLCFEYAREKWPFDLTRALSAKD